MDCGNDGINIPRPPGNRWFPFFNGWTSFTPALPKLYFGVDSEEQRYWLLCKQLHKLICYIDMVGDKVNIDHDEIEKLKEQFRKFIESGFEDYYIELIYKWINEHMAELISHAVKMVYFGLNDEGYFVAYIPESWSDITFDTGHVFGRTDYGRLILRFEADHAIDNTYSYSLSQVDDLVMEKINRLIADLETEVKRTDATFDTLFTNLDEDVILNGNI